MLIREVRASNGEGEALVLGLHRALTVVAGLLPDEQIELADILAAMVYGRTDDLGGRVEIDGEDISAQMWGVRVGEQFDDVDVFVRRSDIGHASEAPTGGLEAESVLEARAALAGAEKALSAAERDLEPIRSRAEQARAAVATLGAAPEVAGADDASEEHHDESYLEAARSELVEADEAAAAADQELADAEQEESAARELITVAESERDARAAAAADATEGLRGAQAVEDAARDALEAAREALDRARESATPDLDGATQAVAGASARLDDARLDHERAAEAVEAGRAEITAARTAQADAKRSAEARQEREDGRRAAASADLLARSAEELESLDRRAQDIEERLVRARAEESLFAGFAETNGPVAQEAARRGRSGRSGRRSERRGARPEAPDDGTSEADLADVEAEARQATAEASALRSAVEAMRRQAEAAGAAGGDRRSLGVARRAELEREIAALGVPIDTSPVVAAVSELRHVPSGADVDEARDLLAQVEALVASRGGLAVRPAPTWLVDAARTALEEARVELARAEEMARPMRVSAEDASEFERVHAAVVEADAKADRRFGGPMARRRLEKALADERELLLKFGLPSYTAFLLRTMPISSDSAGARHLEEARRAMADAEAVWEELHQAEYPDELAAVEQEEARVLARAASLLGADRMAGADVSSPGATLRSVRALLVEMTAADADVDRAAARLAEALNSAFGSKAAAGDPAGLLAVAEERIAVTEAIGARRAELALELETVGAEIEEIDAAAEGADETSTPDEEAIARAEAAAVEAEGRADEARRRLEMAAIAAGIAPAAAAVAADASTLDIDADGEAGETDTALLDATIGGPASGGEVDWEAQAEAEVERSQREIESLSAELAGVEVRRSELRAQDVPQVTDVDSGPDDVGAPTDDEGAAGATITELEAALVEAEATLASAARHLTEAEEAAADSRTAYDAARAAVAARDDALTLARQAHDQAEAEHRDAVEARVVAEDRRATAERAAAEADAEVEWAEHARARAGARREAAAAERDRCAAELTARRQAFADAEVEVGRRAEDARKAADRVAAEARVRVEQWQRQHDDAIASEADASEAETLATRRIAEARTALELARQALVQAEESAGKRARRGRGAAVEAFVSGRLATARSKPRYGAVPLILLDPFDAEDLRAAAPLLESAAGDVQMVYLTARAEVLQWAEALGPDRAMVLRFGDALAASG